MPRIAQTVENWIGATFDAEIAAIEAGDDARAERIQRAAQTLRAFARRIAEGR